MLLYVLIGALYVVVKIAFVLAGYLHPGAVLHGLVPAALTVVAGLLAQRTVRTGSGQAAWAVVVLILPIIALVTTPIYMFLKAGEAWLTNGRLPVLVIYEVFALCQIALALRVRKHGR
jgi:hypothetical protein